MSGMGIFVLLNNKKKNIMAVQFPVNNLSLLQFKINTVNSQILIYYNNVLQSTNKTGELHQWYLTTVAGQLTFVDSILTQLSQAPNAINTETLKANQNLTFSVQTSSTGTYFLIGHGDLRPISGVELHFNIDNTKLTTLSLYIVITMDGSGDCLINFV
jgi:hypothetical protein